MADIFQIASIVLLLANLIFLLALFRRVSRSREEMLAHSLDAFQQIEQRIDRTARDEGAKSREEMNRAAREQRLELTGMITSFGDSVAGRITESASLQKGQLEIFSDQLNAFAKSSGERLDAVRGESARSAKQLREEVVLTLGKMSDTNATTLKDLPRSAN